MRWKEPVIQIGVPLVMTQVIAIVVLVFGFMNQNKRLDDVVRRLERLEDSLSRRMDRIEDRILAIDSRLANVARKIEALAWN